MKPSETVVELFGYFGNFVDDQAVDRTETFALEVDISEVVSDEVEIRPMRNLALEFDRNFDFANFDWFKRVLGIAETVVAESLLGFDGLFWVAFETDQIFGIDFAIDGTGGFTVVEEGTEGFFGCWANDFAVEESEICWASFA